MPEFCRPRKQGLPGHSIARRLALTGALAAPFIGRGRAAEPDFTLRIGHSAPPTFPTHLRLTEAAAQIDTHSQGRVRLQVFAAGDLGSPMGMLAQVRAGTLDATLVSAQTLTAELNSFYLPLVGFAFTGYDQLWPAIDGGLGALLARQVHERLGLVAAARCFDFGFRQITTSDKRIEAAADLVELPIRTPADAIFIQLLQALRARPVTFALGELQRALRFHAAEGQQGMIELALEAKLYRWQSHCALTNHVWDGLWALFNGAVWGRLPGNLQDVVSTACDKAALAQRKDTVAKETEDRAALEKGGIVFNAVDLQSFRGALKSAGYYDKWRGRITEEGWTVLEKFTGRLA